MTVLRSRPAATICLLTGTVASISLAGLVWAQAPTQTPAENWPFDEHNQAPATQPAPPKTAVQQRLEELYRRDGRPLPDYMQHDASSAPAEQAPAQTQAQASGSADAAAQRNQRPAAQGNVRQQLSDYYQSQGKTMPTAQAAGGSSSSSSSATQPKQTSTAPPAQGHWYDRINPFHHSASPPQTATQAKISDQSIAAADATHSGAVEAAPVTPPAATAQASASSAPAPAAKSGSFWGDMTLRRVPPQTAQNAQPSPPLSVELGTAARLVRKSDAAAASSSTASVAKVLSAPAAASVAAISPSVAPAIVSVPAEPQAGPPVSHKVAAANAVVDANDPTMPFQASSETEADQQAERGPYTGMTLEDEQTQLQPPKLEPATGAKPAAAPKSTQAAPIAKAHQPQPAKSVVAAQQPLEQQQPSDHHADAPGHVSIPNETASNETAPNETAHEPAAPAAPQQSAAPAAQEPHATAEHPHHTQTTAEKVRLIGERSGLRGFKGFCPVVLRDQRELTDANPAFCSIYHGQKYFFSSADAQARFEAAPHKYAPVAGGIDVVVKTNSDQAVEGVLDNALWYKGHIYLFCSPESLQVFINNAPAYSAAAERIQQ